MEVEEDKGADRGYYLTPELYGAPVTARIGYEAPPPASEHVVHHGPPIRPRGNATPAHRLPPPRPPLPLRPVVPSLPPVPHRVAQATTPAVNQK
ncbi:MAG: hypothetical protein WAN23_09535 [Candidatus Acidiferrales bacterium]